jgi:demethylmenaquinone methyltransferase/2-methoxy-6-polyprenyl-1,4-benzoquinol methylase
LALLVGPIPEKAGQPVVVRVTKKGGRIVIAEFSSPVWRPFRIIYTNYLMRALPAIAKKTSSNPDAYIYLAESIRAWPDQKALAARIADAGWTQIGWRNLTFGVVAVHMAVKA